MGAASAIDPWTAAFGAVASVAKPVAAAPNYATGGTVGTTFDNSGLNVIFGDGNSLSTERTQVPATIGSSVASATGQIAAYAPYLAIGAVVLIVLKKRRHA